MTDNPPEWSEQELELLALVRGDKPKEPEPQAVATPKPVVEAPAPPPEPVQEKPEPEKPKAETLPAKRIKRSYTEEQVERGLAELVMAGGNWRLASRNLASADIEIPHETLRSWLTTKREQMEAVRSRLEPVIHRTVIAEVEGLALLQANIEREASERLLGEIPGLPGRDLAGAVRNISTAKAINIDKAQLLRGNPTSIVEKRSGEEIVDSLASKYPHLAVEGTAVEIEDAELAA